jgi:Bacterial Ig-like domain
MPIDEATVTNDTFTLRETDNNEPVNADVTLHAEVFAVLTPRADLSNGTRYTAKISKTIKSISGYTLEKDKEWSFTTALT